ncbi:MAG TPA: CAP domain-containing protein [Planctomycetota bacterium]|nr:CAP domain-containing protein [Planctomycetota bacterium]
MNKRKTGAVSVFVLAVLVGCQGGDASEPLDASSTAYEAVGDEAHPYMAAGLDEAAHSAEAELEDLVNQYRFDRGLGALRILPELKDLALAHSIHMGRHEPAFFDHRNPEGALPEDRAKGWVECTAIGENIAAGQSAAEAVFRSWLDSPGHRANLEDPKWTHMGAGHAVLPESPYVTYWTLDLIQR